MKSERNLRLFKEQCFAYRVVLSLARIMNQLLIDKFQAINAILLEIKESPEWAKYCEIADANFGEGDDNYSCNEFALVAIEQEISFFLEKVQSDNPAELSISQREFDEESEDAMIPFVWDLIDG